MSPSSIGSITAVEICSLVAVFAALTPLWISRIRRTRARQVIEARFLGLGETVVEISHKPFYGASWGTAGLVGGATIHRVVSRTAAGEERVREWAYDPTAAGGLKTFAHGIWIPVA